MVDTLDIGEQIVSCSNCSMSECFTMLYKTLTLPTKHILRLYLVIKHFDHSYEFYLQKSKSMTKLSRSLGGPTERPMWAKHSPGSPFVNMSAVGDPKASIDASVRPLPVKSVRLTTSRTPRDPPSKLHK